MGRGLGITLLALLFAVGCGDDGSPATECSRTSDCATDEVCLDGRCARLGADAGPGRDAASGCSADSECDDGVGCTTDRCSSGGCVFDADHTMCPAGTLCSRSDDCVPGRTCTADAECDDGIYCNGVEACVSGRCGAGMAVDCADTVDCTADVCDEGSDACEHLAVDDRCDDGMFCNGSETCDVGTGCAAGTPPVCADALTCTADACDETADACVAPVAMGTCLIGGMCYSDGDRDPTDFCRECDNATSGTDWSASCTASVADDTFSDFVAGDFGRSRVTFYAAADGSLRTVQRSDVTGDGHPDLIQPQYYTGSTRNFNSVVFRGSAMGLTTTGRINLPTVGGIDSVVADFDADGFPDIAFCNHHNNSTYNISSYVYYGNAMGIDTSRRTTLPTFGCYGVATADMTVMAGWTWSSPTTARPPVSPRRRTSTTAPRAGSARRAGRRCRRSVSSVPASAT